MVCNYLSAYQKWRAWAANYNEVTHLPADPWYVAIYLLHLTQISKTPSPVANAYYGIRWPHKSAGLPDPTSSELPTMIEESASRIKDHGANQKEPVMVEMLSKIVDKFTNDKSCISDLRLAAMC